MKQLLFKYSMEKIPFITMFGSEIRIPKSLLSKEHVAKAAAKHYGVEVVCTPGVFGTGAVGVGWRIESKVTAKVIGYMTISNGVFGDYPDDFEYGVTTFVPFSKQWSYFHDYRVRYIDESVEIRKG